MSVFSKRFKKERKNKGLTQKELAEKFHTDKSSISKYENGHSMPELPILQEYADFFGVSIDYLLGNSNERRSSDSLIKEYKEKGVEVEELLDRFNVELNGEALTKKDKKVIINVLKTLKEEADQDEDD